MSQTRHGQMLGTPPLGDFQDDRPISQSSFSREEDRPEPALSQNLFKLVTAKRIANAWNRFRRRRREGIRLYRIGFADTRGKDVTQHAEIAPLDKDRTGTDGGIFANFSRKDEL